MNDKKREKGVFVDSMVQKKQKAGMNVFGLGLLGGRQCANASRRGRKRQRKKKIRADSDKWGGAGRGRGKKAADKERMRRRGDVDIFVV